MDKGANKRVLIFSTTYLPNIGGAEVAIREITDRLPDYEFELICARLETKFQRKELMGRVLVHRLGFGHKLDKLLVPFWGLIKIWQINRKRKINLFWPVMVTYSSCSVYIYNALRFWNKIAVVLTPPERGRGGGVGQTHPGLFFFFFFFCVL